MKLLARIGYKLFRLHIGHIYPVRDLLAIFRNQFEQPVPLVFGKKIYLHPKDTVISPYIREHGFWEWEETWVLKKNIKKGDVVFDIGANIGYFTLLASTLVGPTGKVVAFEPDVENCAYLNKTLAANGCKNVEVVQKAVAANDGKGILYLEDENKGDHRITKGSESRQERVIDLIMLDSYIQESGHAPSFIKMDIQGAEGQALRGMKQLLRSDSKFIMLMEFWPFGLSEANEEYEKIFDQLSRYFSIQVLREGEEKVFPTTKKEILARNTIKNKLSSNLVLTHKR